MASENSAPWSEPGGPITGHNLEESMKLILQDDANRSIEHDWDGVALPLIVVDGGLYFIRTAIQDSRAQYALVPAGQVAAFGALQKPLIKSYENTGAPECWPFTSGVRSEPILPLNDHTTPNRILAPLAAAPPPAERENCLVGAAEYQSVRDERGKLQRQVEELTRRLKLVREERAKCQQELQIAKGRAQRAENNSTELQHYFEMRWKADRRAIALWRQADPTRELVMPDHADLCLWLLDNIEGSHAREEKLRSSISEAEDHITNLEGIGEGKSQALVAAQRLCKVAQEQRDHLMDECNWILAEVVGARVPPPASVSAEPSQPWWDATKRLAADLAGICAGKDTELAELRTRRDELLTSNNRLVEEKRALERDNQRLAEMRDNWSRAFAEEYQQGGKVLRGLRAIRDLLDTQIPREGQGDAATPLEASAGDIQIA